MNDAIIGFIGVIVGAVISYVAQMRATKMTLEAELRRLRTESNIRDKETRAIQIREWLAEILAESDPDINKDVDYRKIVVNIFRLQLILDTRTNKSHALINDAIIKLGLAFQTKTAMREEIYALQSQIIEAAKSMN
jgi:hypothetical protein